jgi:hypothetical protein
MFIAYDMSEENHSRGLGRDKWETPVGEVIEGMENVEKFYARYGGAVVQETLMDAENGGLPFAQKHFPKLDGFKTCTVMRLTYPRVPAIKPWDEDDIQQASLGALMLHNPLFRKLFLGVNRLGLLLVLKLMSFF